MVASKSCEVRYQEICRDPPEVDRDFSFSFRVDELKPGVSYRFRIRAFNAFGAGELKVVMVMVMTVMVMMMVVMMVVMMLLMVVVMVVVVAIIMTVNGGVE